MGEEGFVRDSSVRYHVHPPAAIVKSEGLADAAAEPEPGHPLLPRHLRTAGRPARGRKPDAGRRLLFGNDEVRVWFAAVDSGSDLYRDSAGDEVVHIQNGSAVLQSVCGSVSAVAGDCVVVPRGPFTGGFRARPASPRSWPRRARTPGRHGVASPRTASPGYAWTWAKAARRRRRDR